MGTEGHPADPVLQAEEEVGAGVGGEEEAGVAAIQAHGHPCEADIREVAIEAQIGGGGA